MLDEREIKYYCNKYNFSYRYFYNNAVIMTGVDMWRLTEIETRNRNTVEYKIIVEHANKAGNRTGKIQFHSQRIAYDVEWIFENIIIPHQSYNRVYQKAFRLKELLFQVL